MARFVFGVSMDDGTKLLIAEYLNNVSFLAEVSEHDVDDMYWAIKDIEIKQEKLKELLNQRGVNLGELNSLVARYMEIEEISAEVHGTPDSESYWYEDLLAEKEEIKEKLFERGYGL